MLLRQPRQLLGERRSGFSFPVRLRCGGVTSTVIVVVMRIGYDGGGAKDDDKVPHSSPTVGIIFIIVASLFLVF